MKPFALRTAPKKVKLIAYEFAGVVWSVLTVVVDNDELDEVFVFAGNL